MKICSMLSIIRETQIKSRMKSPYTPTGRAIYSIPRNLTPRYLPKSNKEMLPPKSLYTNVYNGFMSNNTWEQSK